MREIKPAVDVGLHVCDIETYPLASMQEGMLFNSEITQDSGVDVEQILGSLPESLNVIVFRQAWERVMARHAVLRTSFHWGGSGNPRQNVHPTINLPFEEHDWRDLLPQEQKSRLEAYLLADRQRGFDLSKAPLMHLALFHIAKTDFRFVWTFHHIILDGRSQSIVLKEVFDLYEAINDDGLLDLEAPPLYHDYIEWFQAQDTDASRSFWREALKGFVAPTPLVVDTISNTVPAERIFHGEQEIYLTQKTTEILRALAEEHQITLNTFVQGAWALLLSRYSHEPDVVFGGVRACRYGTVPGSTEIVGVFINTLPVRVQIDPNSPLIPWLQELRARQIRVRDHEHTPLVKVQSWSDVPPGEQLFESILVFNNYPLETTLQQLGGNWRDRRFHLIEKTNFPLSLYGYADAALGLKISYDLGRFDEASITRMLGHLATLLEGMAANPKQALSTLPMLTEGECQQLIVAWNETQVDYPQDKCIHELIEAQVERTPNSIAVAFGNEQLTYRELNDRANQLARILQKRKVGPDVPVGIYMERSLDMMVALLGVLKAGGTYLPLDPEFPSERLVFMVEDAEVLVLLTQGRLVSELPSHKAQVITVDTSWDIVSSESAENVQSEVAPDNLSHIIYTSGSTGKPKGVMVQHGNVVNFFTGMDQQIPHDPPGTWLAVTSLSFDISVLELFWTLARGFRVVLYADKSSDQGNRVSESSRLAQNGSELKELANREAAVAQYTIPELIQKHGVTHLQSTPTQASMLMIDESAHEALRQLQFYILGGEAFPPLLARQLKQLVSGSIINGYGPTETTIYSTGYQLGELGDTVPIGRPTANTELYILDADRQPVPVGVAGELYIGGDGVVRGYLKRPQLTAERFIPNPFNGEEQGRVYRTGDLVKYRADGIVEYLGRLDHQIKIRGYRIELGEIETVLAAHPLVHEAVVIAREFTSGDTRLAAYIITRTQKELSSSELRRYLQDKLPEFMVPAYYISLDSFPLTPNLKIDRRALQAIELDVSDQKQAYVAPRTELEGQLVDVWEDLLGTQPIGVTDNFFVLGGHSLLAVRLIARIQELTRKKLPVAMLFDAPTVENLARILDADKTVVEEQSIRDSNWLPWVIPIQPKGSKRPFFHMGGSALLYNLARYLGPDQPLFGVLEQDLDGDHSLYTDIADIVPHCLAGIRSVQPQGPYLIGGLCFGGFVSLEVARLLQSQGEEVDLLFMIDAYVPGSVHRLPSESSPDGRSVKEFSYVAEMLQHRGAGHFVRKMKKRLWRKSWIRVHKFYKRIGKPMPGSLRDIVEANTIAADHYAPEPFAGSAVLIQVDGRDPRFEYPPQMGWDGILHDITLHRVPGGHISVYEEPYVKDLAEKLRFCIKEHTRSEDTLIK